MDRRSGLNCYYCHVIIVDNSTRLLMRHLRESHDVGYRGIRDSVINCGNCSYSSRNAKLFSDHVSKMHGDHRCAEAAVADNPSETGTDMESTTNLEACSYSGELPATSCSQSCDGQSKDSEVTPDVCAPSTPTDVCNEKSTNISNQSKQEGVEDFVSRFVLQLYSKGSTTRSQIQSVIDGVADLMEQTLSYLRLECLDAVKEEPSLYTKVMHVFADHRDPFKNHRSEYSRIKTMVTRGLVEPRELAIGSRLDSTSSGIQTVASTIQYIPLKDTLQLLFKNHEFCDSLLWQQHRKHPVGLATLLKANKLFTENPSALQLAVYNDDIEVGNPLGSKTGVNKLTMYYFTILNSPNISSLSSIHLATVAYASDVKKYGQAKVLKPLIDDLKDLEDGVVIDDVEGKV